MIDALYLSLAFTGLAALAAVLVLIGRMAQECPETAGAARLGTWVVVTGFAAIGAGVIALIGAALPYVLQGGKSGLYLTLGLVAVALGIGFYNAATTLRDILKTSADAQQKRAIGQNG